MIKQLLSKIFIWTGGVVTVGIIIGLGLNLVSAWNEPTVTPPNGNIPAPLNISSVSQYKKGSLGVRGLFDATVVKSVTAEIANQITALSVMTTTLNNTEWVKANSLSVSNELRIWSGAGDRKILVAKDNNGNAEWR